MKKLAATLALLCFTPANVAAWEASTTHAGLAEQAALSSRLHKRLVTLGFTGGLFEPLTIPPADAPTLMAALKLLSPTHGAVPDTRGRQTALGWIAAGASIADIPAAHGANHFYDPVTKRGWQAPDRSVIAGLSDKVRDMVGRASLPSRGVPAVDWIVARENPFNLQSFATQYEKSIIASTPAERSRHMAAALVAAGALLHVLGDLGVPSRVRGDSAAHLEPLGGGPDDLGSRFERIAALAYGRLGVPTPSRTITRQRMRDYFTSADGTGLADLISQTYFSTNTLPGKSRISGSQKPALARPLPKLPRLNLMAASRDDGAILRNTANTCLANYRVEHGVVEFFTNDECMLEQVGAILPEVVAYETGLLDFLLRGELTLNITDQVAVSAKGLGAGTLVILVEDERGTRKQIASMPIAGGSEDLARIAAPSSGTRVVALFKGTDAANEPILAVGAMPLTR